MSDVDIEAMDRRATVRGNKAEAELELFDEAFDQLKAAAIEELLATGVDQVEKRERLYRIANTSEAVRKALKQIALDGLIAREALARQDLLRP